MEVANSLMNTQKSVVVAEEIGSGAPKETAAEFRAKHQRMSDVLELSPEAEKIMTEGRKEPSLLEQRDSARKRLEELAANTEGMYLELTPEMISGEQHYSELTSLLGGAIYRAEIEDETDRGLRRDYEMIKNSVEHIENIEIKIQNMRNDSAEAGQNNSHEISSFGMADGIIKSYLINTLEGLRNPQGYYIDPQYARDHILELSDGAIDLFELFEKYLGDDILFTKPPTEA